MRDRLISMIAGWLQESERLRALADNERSEVMHHAYRFEAASLAACAAELQTIVDQMDSGFPNIGEFPIVECGL